MMMKRKSKKAFRVLYYNKKYTWPKDKILEDISDEEFFKKYRHQHTYGAICLFCMRFCFQYTARMLDRKTVDKRKALWLISEQIRILTNKIEDPAHNPHEHQTRELITLDSQTKND